MIIVNRNLHLFHYGIRSIAFVIFVAVTLFYIPLYTARLPPFHRHQDQISSSQSSSSSSSSKPNLKSESPESNANSHDVNVERKRTLDISVSMRVCFEILAPSSEIGLHPPALIMSMCRGKIPPELLVTGDAHNYVDHSSSSTTSFKNYVLQPEDRPYVQKVLRHFSSIVVLHDAAYTLYDSTVRQLQEEFVRRRRRYQQQGRNVTEILQEEQKEEKSRRKRDFKVSDLFLINQHDDYDESVSLPMYQTLFKLADFWLSDFPVALFWAFMTNTDKFLKVVEAVNWLRLLPSLTFLSPQVRGGILTFYVLCLVTGGQYPCSFFEISFAFHFCAFVALVEWIGAVSDRLVIIQPTASTTQTQQQHEHQQGVQNDNNNITNDDESATSAPNLANDNNNNMMNNYFSSINLFASQYNRKVLTQELFGYLVLQVFIPPCVAGFVLSALVALAVLVVN